MAKAWEVGAALASKVLRQAQADEGWCPMCKAKVGNMLKSNRPRHKDWCAAHDLYEAGGEA